MAIQETVNDSVVEIRQEARNRHYSILEKPLHLYPHEQWNYLEKRINIERRFMVLS